MKYAQRFQQQIQIVNESKYYVKGLKLVQEAEMHVTGNCCHECKQRISVSV